MLLQQQHEPTCDAAQENGILDLVRQLGRIFWRNCKLHRSHARKLMQTAFGGSDAEGLWSWKEVYDLQESAFVFMLPYFAEDMKTQGTSAIAALQQFARLEALGLTHTRRNEEAIALQQFSTPLQLAYVASHCARVTPTDLVLEPSAGTGILAQFCAVRGAQVVLNELSDRRFELLRLLFPQTAVHQFNAEHIHDLMPGHVQPSVVVMNPPFSASPRQDRRNPDATGNHVRSAFLRLVPGGRLVLVSGRWFSPDSKFWRTAFSGLEDQVCVRATVVFSGDTYLKHGTSIETRLTVIDKVAPIGTPMSLDIGTEWMITQIDSKTAKVRSLELAKVAHLLRSLPPRSELQLRSLPLRDEPQPAKPQAAKAKAKAQPKPTPQPTEVNPGPFWDDVIDVEYEEVPPTTTQTQAVLYEVYQPQRISIQGAQKHPTTLCESVALSAVRPPMPSYRPKLPKAVVEGLLSEAQLESVVYAGEAHSQLLGGCYKVDETLDKIEVASSGDPDAVQFRCGWFLGDGTGSGKGRQVAGIVLDNWLQGRTKALWLSKSDKLIEDARRDWKALGGDESKVVSLSKFKLGADIPISEGILFTTYATLRGGSRGGKKSRLEQITDWLGADFEGVIAFDEAHSMGNAIAQEGSRGIQEASQQGLTGLRLQNALPDARVVYVSATGASKVSNLAYASRLGLWQTGDFPFPNRSDFISAIESGGVAAMEVVCRDLKALGLYFARNISFEGVEYDALAVPLTPDQIKIYDTYSEVFQVIHTHLEEALAVSGANLNRSAKGAARSAFESNKQRFFNHLLTSMKCPSLLQAMEADLAEGLAPVIQLVSTNEEMIKRRLSEVPTEEWDDLNIDVTPRENIMTYLFNAFPVYLYEAYTTEDGQVRSSLVQDADGNPVICREAEDQRDALVGKVASLPALSGALEQILHHFGHDRVAEVTGRSVRILSDPDGRQYVAKRPASANLSETQSFMDGEKDVLIFSGAGNTGRSYHADLGCQNTRRRVHYLLEAGWQADGAIQGLGRSHRTNQATAPIFRPVVTDVRGERRFISTIARRLDALGALTRGQRQTGGQGLFDSKDNLESLYAQSALRELFRLLYAEQVDCCSLAQFERATGLTLTSKEGGLREDLPSMAQFLNRILALPIQLQNDLFEVFEMLVETRVEAAIATGTFESGVETIQADKLAVVDRNVVYTHVSGSETFCVEVERSWRTEYTSVQEALELQKRWEGRLMVNQKSGRAAVVIPTSSAMSDSGAVIPRAALVRPIIRTKLTVAELENSTWEDASASEWQRCWQDEVSRIPEFTSDRIFLICGLLLPIWNSLDRENMRVYRLQTDDGERLLGRVVELHKMQAIAKSLGVHQVELTASEMFDTVLNQKQHLPLPGGLSLKSSLLMDERRLEITGTVSDGLCEQLKAAGCFTEIISWRRRVFVPTDETRGPEVLEAVVKLLS
ncbi:strawberry notch family protein [Oscillatoria sp. CS-180]|uniref:strawberry notch family protein n=1 Tax=Oscillatoria sp. CS-180 TaxID=3021720 RepID=UPI00232F924F|nr:strawberry notch family protein [Oscillatoria sp. CS-180]MDB9529551.1 strawberry notch family protein [Oscillatoria sp. CS-180]